MLGICSGLVFNALHAASPPAPWLAPPWQGTTGKVDRAALAEVREELNLAVSLMNAASQRVEQVGAGRVTVLGRRGKA